MTRIYSTHKRRPSPPYGRLGKCLRSIDRLVQEHGRDAARGPRCVSFSTAAQRKKYTKCMMRRLHAIGRPIVDVHNLNRVHIGLLFRDMADQGLKPATLQTYSTHLARLCEWIDKPNMMGDPRQYLDDPCVFDRTYAAQIPATLPVPPIDVEAVIAAAREKCGWVALQLELCWHFGMRPSEAMRYCPRMREGRDEASIVFKGAKNRRFRSVPIETDAQRELLERAKAAVPFRTSSMIPHHYTLKRWRCRFYYVTRRIGLTERGPLRATARTMRHAYARRTYLQLTGYACPADGGNGEGLSRAQDREARLIIADRLGHTRESITTAYLGPIVTGPKGRNGA